MTKIELTTPNTPVLVSFTVKSLVSNPFSNTRGTVEFSHQNSLSEPWAVLPTEGMLIVDVPLYFKVVGNTTDITLPVVELA